MADDLKVDTTALASPAKRFEAGSRSVTAVTTALRTAAQAAGSGAQHPVVAQAAEVFASGMGGALQPFGAECLAMSTKLTAAAVRYHVTDETAVVVQIVDMDLTNPGAPQ